MAKALMQPQMAIVRMDVSPVSELTAIWSPKVYINSIPWEVEVKKEDDENSLAIFLHCAKKVNSSDWAISACATVSLLPFSRKKSPLVHHIKPNVFDSSGSSYGTSELIKWNELLKNENKYVKKDTIQLKIEITADNPNDSERSILNFKTTDKCCDDSSHAIFRLTVRNVKNLVAVRTPQFNLRGLPWHMTLYKCQTSNLGIKLSNESCEEASCKIGMTVKLLSSKYDMDPIEKIDHVDSSSSLKITQIISWDEMLKSRNGFNKKDVITLEVKLKADKPECDGLSNTKRRRLECAICFEALDNQDLSITPCGHLFCTTCITNALKKRKVCPTCQATVKNLQRAHLPL